MSEKISLDSSAMYSLYFIKITKLLILSLIPQHYYKIFFLST